MSSLTTTAETQETLRAERDALKEALRETEARLRTVTELFPAQRFSMDASGTIRVFEGLAETLLGLRPENYVGRTLEDAMGHNQVAVMHLRRALQGKEVRWTQELGGYIWDNHCIPLFDTQGNLVSVNGIAVDVTEKRNAEIEARWRDREIVAMNAILAEVSSVLNLSDILAIVRRQLAQQLMIPGGVIYLLDFSRFQLERQGSWGVPPEIVERTDTLVEELHATPGESYSAHSIDGLYPEGHAEELWQAGYCVPLITNGQHLGILTLFGHEPMTLRKHRPAFYDTLGQQLGTALQNARLFNELRSGREELQTLTRRLVEVQEAERLRLARELHDEIGQIVTGLKMTIELAAHNSLEVNIPRHEEAKRLVRDLMNRVRQMSLDLRPTMLDDLGLFPALLWHFDRYTAQTNTEIRFQHSGIEGRRFGDAIETAIYRLTQEALTNVARHSGGVAEVSVILHGTAKTLELWVEDQGVGFDTENLNVYKSSGLSGMRERVIALNGTIDFTSLSDQGTTVAVQLPLVSLVESVSI
jgi:PAS domain S-box-containing protein